MMDDTALFRAKTIDVQLVTDTPRSKVFPRIAASDTKNIGLTAMFANVFPSLYSTDQFWRVTVPVSVLNFGEYSSEESAPLVQNMLRKVSARLTSLSDVPVQLTFEAVGITSEHSRKKLGENKYDVLRFVQGNIYRTPSEVRSDWAFQIEGVSGLDWEHRERLSFVLSQMDTFEISFQTGKQPIPCGLAAVFCSSFKHFSGGSFCGEFSISKRSGSNSQTTRLNNVFFKDVPLAPLVGPYTDFAVEGTIIDFQLTQAVFGAEGTSVEGRLNVKDGAIDRTLFHHCVDKFQLTVYPESVLDSPIPMIPFTDCAILFRLQPAGIDFWAHHLWQDMFMCYHEGGTAPYALRVYLPTQRRTVTYHELMSVFAADGAPVVPLIPGFQSLVPHLPIR
jgi:hypothetical protein